MAQIVEKFRVGDADIAKQVQDYLDDNDGYSAVTMARVNAEGDEELVVVFSDGQ